MVLINITSTHTPVFDKEVKDLKKKNPQGKIFLNVDIFPHSHFIFGVGALCGEGT